MELEKIEKSELDVIFMATGNLPIHYKYHLHPLFKLIIYMLFNLFAFLPDFKTYRIFILILEIILAFAVKLRFDEIRGFFKFLSLNFIGLYIIFYFVEFDFFSAGTIFINYVLTILILFLGAFIFTKATPPHELIIAFESLHIPKGIVVGITIALDFLPLLTQKVRQILAYQQARGYRLRFNRLGSIIIPGLLFILDLSINLSISLESRGFALK